MAVTVFVSDQWHPSSALIENEFSSTSFPPIPHGVYRNIVTIILCDQTHVAVDVRNIYVAGSLAHTNQCLLQSLWRGENRKITLPIGTFV